MQALEGGGGFPGRVAVAVDGDELRDEGVGRKEGRVSKGMSAWEAVSKRHNGVNRRVNAKEMRFFRKSRKSGTQVNSYSRR